MSKTIEVIVDWDTDDGFGNPPPSVVPVPSEVFGKSDGDEDVTDWLSDTYGWLINTWRKKNDE